MKRGLTFEEKIKDLTLVISQIWRADNKETYEDKYSETEKVITEAAKILASKIREEYWKEQAPGTFKIYEDADGQIWIAEEYVQGLTAQHRKELSSKEAELEAARNDSSHLQELLQEERRIRKANEQAQMILLMVRGMI